MRWGRRCRYEDVAPDTSVNGDLDKLKQVISILLANAIKYGAEGAPITLSSKRRAPCKLQVTNQGPPIPAEQLTHLFERFYRADASRGEKAGLDWVCPLPETIAAEHKGTLRAESDAESTRFILTLPLLRK